MSAALDMWAALNASRHAVAAQDALVARTEHLVQRWRTRPRGDAHARRRRRKALRHALDGRGGRGGPRRTAGGAPESPDSSWRSGGSGAIGAVVAPTARTRLLLVLGIITNPRTPHTRAWIRETYKATATKTVGDAAIMRFVIGERGLSDTDQRALAAERARFADLEFISASDFNERGGIFSCIDKLFAWFPHAVGAFPGAAFYAKADDDSYVDVPRLLRLLSAVPPVPNAYLGYVQYDSFLPDQWKHCGWAAGPVGAVQGHAHGCAKGALGPFPFVVGALTVVGADLAHWMRSSRELAAFVRAGRASQAERVKHWDCGYSDVTLGHALAQSNLSISLVAVRRAMRDATYGAMQAKHFVVSHHLRTKAHFEREHADALAATEWMPEVTPCTEWPRVWQIERPALKLKEENRRELQRAMAGFACCQRWRVCEVAPAGSA